MTEPSLLRCRSCRRYTLSERCPSCGGASGTPHPARYSPQDRYARYRRALYALGEGSGARTP
jgi:H/ACA ribonucleoprotein complex subunit 3